MIKLIFEILFYSHSVKKQNLIIWMKKDRKLNVTIS